MGSRHPVNKLTALEVARLKIPGRYADGNNLYLLVEPSGAKRWVLRLTVNGRRRDMGFGNSIVIPLKKAREMAIYYKSLAKSGLDPILERKKEQGLNISFQICAENVFKIVEPSLKNKKFAKSWISSLERYAYFYIGKKPILPEIDISTNATVNITEQTIALKENKIKELDQQILLGSEIDSILETQQLQAMADPSNVRLTTKHESLPFLIHSTYFYYFYSVYIYHSRS